MSTTTSPRHVTLPTPGMPRRLDRLRFFSVPAETRTPGAGDSGDPSGGDPAEQPKPTETVDFWKQKAREQEKRAKENAAAAKRLSELEDAQKTDAQKAADALAEVTSRAESAERRAQALSVATEHKLGAEDAALIAELRDEDAMRSLAKRLAGVAEQQSNKAPSVPRQGTDTTPPKADPMREHVRRMFDAAKTE